MVTRLVTAIAMVAALAAPVAAQEREGIMVKGHWVLNVYNPDGTFVLRREFDNSATAAARLLPMMLQGIFTFGGWRIDLHEGGLDQTSPFSGGNGQFDPTVTFNLINALTLSGQTTADRDGTIKGVQSRIYTCDAKIAPADCGTNIYRGNAGFTGTSLSTPLPLVAGQIIQVTVTITFSSAPHPPSE